MSSTPSLLYQDLKLEKFEQTKYKTNKKLYLQVP
jgi:hypothetical protein